MSINSKLLAVAGLLVCSIVSADLYTGHVASIEWKAHSSDAVLLVSVQLDSSGETSTKLIEVVARGGDEIADAEAIAKAWVPSMRFNYQEDWRPEGEWLLFVRRWNDKEPTIDHTVYLENPLQASWMSAVTADGKILEDKQQILSVIKDRLANGEQIPRRQRAARHLVDKGHHPSRREPGEFGTPEDVSPWLGGFQIPADIDTWDVPADDRSFDEDLWVRGITVPADEIYRKALFDFWSSYIRKSREERRQVYTRYPSVALINYPGERTEQLLLHLNEMDEFYISSRAKSALRYLRFHQPAFDQQDRQLLGSWVLTTSSQRVQFDLMDDYHLIAHRRPVPFPHPSKHQREWFAKGRWNLHNGRLRLLGMSLRLSNSDRFRQQSSPLPQLYHLPIVQIANDAITFKKGVVLQRVKRPIEIPKSASR